MQFLDFEKPLEDLYTQMNKLKEMSAKNKVDVTTAVRELEASIEKTRSQIYTNLTPWQRVQLSRHPDRPYTLKYIEKMCSNFIELHGDRNVKDDKAMVGGFAQLGDETVMILGQQKGNNTKTRQLRNFGMANPEGYRKALRLMKLAEKFNKPVVTLIDTPGAYPGLEAEERGQAEAIARNIMEMSRLKVPIIVCVIGEGASGGALGIGVGDRILMLQYCWYSVISPESCSSILFRSWEYKEQAAEALQLSANDLVKHKIVDRIVPEPEGGAHRNHKMAADFLKSAILDELKQLEKNDPDKFLDQRVKKYSAMGYWEG